MLCTKVYTLLKRVWKKYMRSIDKCCIPFADVFSTQLAPLTLGIEMVGGVMAKLIPRTCIIPAKKSQVFTTYQDE
jgi:molecular chaperone DnaK (HSP70)